MTEQFPAPPTPPEADLRGMQYMPFKGDRAFTSTTWVSASPEGRCAALRLWWHAFAKEVPAGSLPDNDRLLADYAGYGVALKAWLKIKPEAMRGWFECTDGRLYHNVVAEVVAEVWEERKKYRAEREKWREKSRRKRGHVSDTSPETTANVPETSPEKSLLRERERDYPQPPPKNSRVHGTNRRAFAPKPVPGNGTGEHLTHLPPTGMRNASFDQRDAWLREQGKTELVGDYGNHKYPKWIPLEWKPAG